MSSFQRIARGQPGTLLDEPALLNPFAGVSAGSAARSGRWQPAGDDGIHSWDAMVRAIVLGRKVNVTLTEGALVKGVVVGITATSMTVRGVGAPQVVPREDVVRVRYAGARKKHVLWGMAIGAVAAGAVCMLVDASSSNPEPAEAAIMGATFFGIGPGAAVGAMLPAGTLLYEAGPRAPL